MTEWNYEGLLLLGEAGISTNAEDLAGAEAWLEQSNYDRAKRAIKKLHTWIMDDEALAEFEANTDRKLVMRRYARLASDYSLETDALMIRFRAEKEFKRLERSHDRR